MSSYGTRRATQQATPLPIPIVPTSTGPVSSEKGGSSYTATSATSGKTRRPSTSSLARRRLSQSNTTRPSSGTAVASSYSVPSSIPLVSTGAGGGRGRSSSSATVPVFDEEDDGEIRPGSIATGKRGQIFACEKCSKHWKEASKLLLSKHQQVQLLEAAAILKAASAGSSLPDQKDFWPAAVSPPSSGLLGSHSLNINVLTSPRMFPSRSLRPDYEMNPSELDDEEEEEREEDPEEGEDTSESVSTMGDDNLEKGMFDMELEPESILNYSPNRPGGGGGATKGLPSVVGEGARSGSEGMDSGYGSLPPNTGDGGGNAQFKNRGTPLAAPALGFFHPTSSPSTAPSSSLSTSATAASATSVMEVRMQ